MSRVIKGNKKITSQVGSSFTVLYAHEYMQVIIGLSAQHWLKQREKTIFQMKSKSKKKVTKYIYAY